MNTTVRQLAESLLAYRDVVRALDATQGADAPLVARVGEFFTRV
jgi:hypothetical protein